jgi:DNA-binding winged helix-turn-helix (wHTH) protein
MSIANRVSRRYGLCPAKHKHCLYLYQYFRGGVESFNFPGGAMTSQPIGLEQSTRFGEDFELDLRPRRLRRGRHVLKLERIPLEILILLLEHRGEIVSREKIVDRVWGNDVFLDTDNSIRGAIRKVRQALKDDPETPRFIQTVTGRGYRFIAPIISPEDEHSKELPNSDTSVVPIGARTLVSEPDSWPQAGSLGLMNQEQELTAGQVPLVDRYIGERGPGFSLG